MATWSAPSRPVPQADLVYPYIQSIHPDVEVSITTEGSFGMSKIVEITIESLDDTQMAALILDLKTRFPEAF